jgi:hypothetical protein
MQFTSNNQHIDLITLFIYTLSRHASDFLLYDLMLNPGKKILALRDKKNKLLCCRKKKF